MPNIERREEGESGHLEGRVSNDCLEAIAVWDTIPQSERAKQPEIPQTLVELSARVGVSPARIRAVRKTARYERLHDEVLRHVARAMLPEVLFAQYKRSVEWQDPQSARYIRELALGETAGRGNTFNLIQGNQITINNEESIREDEEIIREVEQLARTSQLVRRMLKSGVVEVEAEDDRVGEDPGVG